MALPRQQPALPLDQRLGFAELPRLADHRKHDVERTAGGAFQQRPCLDLHQRRPAERQAQCAPAHRRVFLLVVALQIGHCLVAADIDGAEDHRPRAGGIEDTAIQRLLAFAARQRRRHQKLEFGAEQPDAIGAGQVQRLRIIGKPGVHHHLDAGAIAADSRQVLDTSKGFGALRGHQSHRLIGRDHRRLRPYHQRAIAGIQDQFITIRNLGEQVIDAAEHRHAHGARHDNDMRGQAAFLEDDTAQETLVIFEQFGRSQIARDQNGVALQPRFCRRAQLP